MLFLMKSLLLSTLMILFATGAKAGMPILTEQDTVREVILKNGVEFVVRLPANPTTGYSWSMTVSPSDLLRQEKAPLYLPSDHMGKLVGSGGYECWRFRFVKQGSAKLSFSYARPWEKGVPPVRRLDFTISAKR
jgi:inhibitor of cysteine peptidase